MYFTLNKQLFDVSMIKIKLIYTNNNFVMQATKSKLNLAKNFLRLSYYNHVLKHQLSTFEIFLNKNSLLF